MLDKLVELGRDEQNLDVTALQDARPWLRPRVRDYRVLYALAPTDVYEIERIVHRRDLDSAAAGLPQVPTQRLANAQLQYGRERRPGSLVTRRTLEPASSSTTLVFHDELRIRDRSGSYSAVAPRVVARAE